MQLITLSSTETLIRIHLEKCPICNWEIFDYYETTSHFIDILISVMKCTQCHHLIFFDKLEIDEA